MTDHAPPHLPPPPPPSATHLETAPNCPRCAAANTKFCYYNNYSLSQPRYFCKSCRRYWTNGGSLRNVPVARRKPRRSKSSAAPRPTKSPVVSTQILTQSNPSSEIDLAAVFARFLNSDPQTLTSSPESADPSENPTAENSEIFFEGLSDLDQKQGITEDYETFPFGLQTQLGVEEFFPSQQIQEFDSFSCNYNANHFRLSDQFYPMGDNWVNDIDFF